MPESRDLPQKILVFGCGYLGTRVAARAASADRVVFASTRSHQKATQLAEMGAEPWVADWTDRRSLRSLPKVDAVLVAVSYDARSPHSRFESQVLGLKNLLEVLPAEVPICYISTTGVYHQSDGGWVDETSPARPTREGGQVHLAAEAMLHRLRPQQPWTILRLAGIYGPQRVPRAADVIAGRPIESPPDGYLNLIHVEDAASAVLASWRASTQRLYLVADDQPVLRRAFYQEIARQCRVAPPQFVASDPDRPDSAARVSRRGAGNKRIWNRRMKRDLIPRLMFPSYRQGLEDVLASRS